MEERTELNRRSIGVNFNNAGHADVLLWDAECEVEIGSLDKAEQYVNQIRTRAADPTGWVYANATYNAASSKYTPQTVPADRYSVAAYPAGAFTGNGQDYARKAVRFERRLELALEGHRFFDLVRWGIAAEYLNAYLQKEKDRLPANLTGVIFTANKNEYFPIPQLEIDLNNKLKQNPGY